MQRASRFMLVVGVVAGLSFATVACKSKDKEHPKGDHPKSATQPGAEHPKGEHPK